MRIVRLAEHELSQLDALVEAEIELIEAAEKRRAIPLSAEIQARVDLRLDTYRDIYRALRNAARED